MTFQKGNQIYKLSKWKFAIHHIDFDKKNNQLENLITLCRSCHAETNYERTKWIEFYKKFMREVK